MCINTKEREREGWRDENCRQKKRDKGVYKEKEEKCSSRLLTVALIGRVRMA